MKLNLASICRVILVLALASLASRASADVIKADNGTALNLGGSYSGGVVPTGGDLLLINGTMTADQTASLGDNVSVLGITGSSTKKLTINATTGKTLIIGASGISLSAAGGLTFSNLTSLGGNINLTGSGVIDFNGGLNLTANQSWALGGSRINFNNTLNTGGNNLSISGSATNGILSFYTNNTLGSEVTIGTLFRVYVQNNTVTFNGTNNSFLNFMMFGGTANVASMGIVGGNSSIGKGSASVQSGATLNYTGNTFSSDKGFSRDNNGNSTINVTSTGQTLSMSGNLTTGTATSTGGWVFGGAGNLTLSGVISNAASTTVTKNGSGTLTLSNTNLYQGATSVTGGLLRVTGSTHASSAVGVSAGALGGTGTVNGAVTLSSTGGINLNDGAVGTLTLGSTLAITGAAGANNLGFDLASAGTTTDKIAATGAFSMTTSGAGVVALNQLGGVSNRLTAGTYDLVTAASGLTAGGGNFTLSTTKAFGQTFSLASSTTTALKLTTTQVTAATPAAFWKGGADNWSTASNWNSTAAGGDAASDAPDYQTNVTFSTTTPTPGNLTTNTVDTDFDINSLTFNAAAGGVTIGGTKMLTIEATNANGNTVGNGITSSNTSGTNTIAAKVGLASNQTWTVGTGGTLAVSGAVGDFGGGYSFTKAGAGILNLSGANTFTGATTISGGTLILANLKAIANSASVSVASGTMLQANQTGTYTNTGTVTIAGTGVGANRGALDFQQNGSLTWTAPIALSAAATIHSFGTAITPTLNGAISGTGPLTIASRGGAATHSATWTLGAASTYSGNTNIFNDGGLKDITVKLGVADALPTTTSLNLSATTSYGGLAGYATLDLNGRSQTLAGLTDTGGSAPATATSGKRVINSSATLSTLTLNIASGTNTYGTTGTNILAGTIGGTTAAGAAANNLALTKIGAGTLILSGANTYTGLTTVSAGTLTYGANNIVSTGNVTINGGTLNMVGFTDSVGAVSITSGTLKMVANQTSTAQLVSTGAVSLAGTLDLTGMSTTDGLYKLVSGTSLSGTFGMVTGLSSDYTLKYGTINANELDAQHKATIGTITGTPASASIITGGSTTFNVTTGNSAPTGSADLAFSAASGSNTTGSIMGPISVAPGATSSATSGLSFNGTTIGTNQTASFTVNDSNATNSGLTGSVTVNVFDHASPVSTPVTLDLGNIHAGYGSAATSTTSFTVANGTSGDYRVDLKGTAASGTNNVSINSFTGLQANGSTATLQASLSTGIAAGTVLNQNITYTYGDDSALSGANASFSTASLAVTGQVYSGAMIWNGSSGSFGTHANWNDSTNASVHVAPGLDAGFTGVDSATFGNTTGSVTVSLNGASPSLNAITFNNTGSYTIAPGSGGSLTLAGTSPSVTVAGSHTISAPTTLNGSSIFSVASGGALAASGAISETGGASSITKTGTGTLEFTAANTYSGGTTISNGTVLANNASGSALGTGNLNVASGAALVASTSPVAIPSSSTAR